MIHIFHQEEKKNQNRFCARDSIVLRIKSGNIGICCMTVTHIKHHPIWDPIEFELDDRGEQFNCSTIFRTWPYHTMPYKNRIQNLKSSIIQNQFYQLNCNESSSTTIMCTMCTIHNTNLHTDDTHNNTGTQDKAQDPACILYVLHHRPFWDSKFGILDIEIRRNQFMTLKP